MFPDFFKNETAEVWQDLIIKHHSNNLTFDGLWIVSVLFNGNRILELNRLPC